jgi:hypothetical protein
MTDTPSATAMVDAVKAYFRSSDRGEFPAQLFTPDFEFYFPKFGVGRGLEEFYELAGGMAAAGARVTHQHDQFTFILGDRQVVVEGTTRGLGLDGGRWSGGETPGGRFCSTFQFTDGGLIDRMYVYLDPDYTSADKPRFRWNRARPRW